MPVPGGGDRRLDQLPALDEPVRAAVAAGLAEAAAHAAGYIVPQRDHSVLVTSDQQV